MSQTLIIKRGIEIEGILCQIDGKAQLFWTEDKKDSVDTFYNKKQYFQAKHYYIGGKDHKPITLDAGLYSYPFSYVLPPELPCSFEGDYGYIRYAVKVILKRPWKFNLEYKALFTVISTYNLTQFPHVLNRGKIYESTVFYFKKRPLKSVITISKTSYITGETVSVAIELNNASEINVYGINLYFQQCIEYRARTKTRCETTPLKNFTLGTLGPRNTKTVTTPILLPELPLTTVYNSSIIDVRYEIMQKVRKRRHSI